LKHYLPVVEKVTAQSEARIFEGASRRPEKILSLFEPHGVVYPQGQRRPNPMSFGAKAKNSHFATGSN
jgi:hypothetical protein